MAKQYTYEALPAIIVYTNAIDQSQRKLAEELIKNTYTLKNEMIPILAKEKSVISENGKIKSIKPFNLEKFKERSIELSISAKNSACSEGFIKDIKDYFIYQIIDIFSVRYKRILSK